MSKNYFRVSERKQKVLDSRKLNFSRGYEIGFYSAHDYINLKKKSTSYIYAFPFSGKTSLLFNILIFIAKTYGAKIAIYSPETGDDTALVSFLVQVYLKKKLHGKHANTATDEEWLEALNFLDNHFIFLDPVFVGEKKVNFSAKEMFNQIYTAQKEYGWKIDIAVIDPYNLLSREESDRRKSIADYTLDNLTYINHVAKTMDMHIMVAMHLRDEEANVDKETGTEYMPKPFPNKIANGQSVWRVGQLMMGMWRCPEGVVEKSTGVPYPNNRTDILIQKNKMLGAGQVGKFSLYYDEYSQSFYEVVDGVKYYCGDFHNKAKNNLESSTIKPNLDFGNNDDDDLIF